MGRCGLQYINAWRRAALALSIAAMAVPAPTAWAGRHGDGWPAAAATPRQAEARQTGGTATYTIYLPALSRPVEASTLDVHVRQSALDFYRQEYLGTLGTPLTWSGSLAACDPGATNEAYRQAIGRRINYFRAMAGVPARVTFSAEANQLAQAAALMMSANRSLSHNPPPDWRCYSSDGADGAGSSNLHLSSTPADPISNYMRDAGAGNAALGHRRWILYPQTETMGTGDIPAGQGYPSTNALLVFDAHMWASRPDVRDVFVAWPPAGYVPYPVVYARWSFSYPNADFGAAAVRMTQGGAPVAVAQASPVQGYGENTLAWIPLGLSDGAAWPRPAGDTTYVVTVENVRVDGQSRTFSYAVTVFDPG
jgi:uncharacterized protein YkwD